MNVPHYSWMSPNLLPHMKTVTEGLESLPATTATFTLSRIGATPGPHNELVQMLAWHNAWVAPPHVSQRQMTRFINPNYKGDLGQFSDGFVRCDCGGYIINARNQSLMKHNPPCPVDKWEATQAKLLETRRPIIEECADKYIPGPQVAARLGITQAGFDYTCNRLNIRWGDRYLDGRHRTIATWKMLKDDYMVKEIAEAFGVPEGTVTAFIYATPPTIPDIEPVHP